LKKYFLILKGNVPFKCEDSFEEALASSKEKNFALY